MVMNNNIPDVTDDEQLIFFEVGIRDLYETRGFGKVRFGEVRLQIGYLLCRVPKKQELYQH